MPPPSISATMRVAPASSAFSTSSFTTAAGRSITSPAAMRFTISVGSNQIVAGPSIGASYQTGLDV